MGWLSIRHQYQKPCPVESNVKPATEDVQSWVEHIEHARSTPCNLEFPFQHESTPDHALPFIPADRVREQAFDTCGDPLLAWIVIDNIVYDCTNFIHQHPGGDTVIRSFVGEDCSWQFHRLHSRQTMEEYGRPLRVGRTEGIQNRFKEIPRYIGSSKLKSEEW
ncbi:hypothetical protein N7510_007933 [Penicillium lagena]|uniref:uncharacterized protein n=1 Tax=Penicillium lagena TaxID=94218 RepID=UPI0025413BFA|nr:uncharacterized protein N7510_007933 [Penicillium lagena]KAJ5611214.1 hypothetical protein N7510_007933 [Penicillium lagena]